MKLKRLKTGVLAFVIVLLFMPIGHTLMVLNEVLLHENKYIGAGVIGFLGFGLLYLGVMKSEKKMTATLLGLVAGILIWTGWVEFSFVWIASKLNVQPLMENNEIATKPEYLVMLSSLGLLASILTFYLFKQSYCQFFNWFQSNMGFKDKIKEDTGRSKPMAVTTFIETIIILWTFYILLLVVYDKDMFGDRHTFTYIVAYGSLLWSGYLFLQLIKIKKFAYAIRYAVPTVIIFWNFIEIIGRWDWFKEVWVHPKEHWVENILISSIFLLFLAYAIYDYRKFLRQTKTNKLSVAKKSTLIANEC